MRMRRNPAAIAGLAGLAVASAPVPAHALTLDEVAGGVFSNPTTAFVAGALGGAVVTGVVSGIVCHSLLTRDVALQDNDIVDAYLSEGKHIFSDNLDAGQSVQAAQASFDDSFVMASPFPQVSVAYDEEPAGATADLSAATDAQGTASEDYEQIAQAYVQKKHGHHTSLGGRAQGVAKALRERINAEMMDGLPVIERPDGTVADVGTDWWNISVGIGSISKIDDYVAGDSGEMLAIPSDFKAMSGKERLVEAAKNPSEFMHGDISQRLAFVDEGEYPEVRSADDSFADDVWASALRSMDERLNAHDTAAGDAISMPFCDIVGDMDTLDEPDGLAQQTTFLPFKTPAGHPEVVDTETYVDYLINEEFSHNSSKATRKAAGRFLRLLEGGASTRELNPVSTRSTGQISKPYVAKHFMEPPMVREA